MRNLSLSLWLSGWIAAIVCGHGASGKINTDWANAVRRQRNNNNTIICYGCRGERAALPRNDGFALVVQVREKNDSRALRTLRTLRPSRLSSASHCHIERGHFSSTAISTTTIILRLIGGYKMGKIFVVLCTQQ